MTGLLTELVAVIKEGAVDLNCKGVYLLVSQFSCCGLLSSVQYKRTTWVFAVDFFNLDLSN